MKQKIYNTLYGVIVADALGVPVEFTSREERKANPVTDMIGYGTYNLPKGSWSDDSSMMLCLAESIGRLKTIDYDDIMKNFSAWFNESKFTPDNDLFDIGGSCRKSIMNYLEGIPSIDCGQKSEFDNGNGSLMRIAPLPIYLFYICGSNDEENFELIHNISKLTHGHAISLIGCDIYCSIMIEILSETKKSDLIQNTFSKLKNFTNNHPEYSEALSKYSRISQPDFSTLPENEIKTSGYVVDSLEAALWCFLTTDNYKDCVLKAVNLGSDTDTVACIAGSIAGLYYGNIPEEWIKTLRNKKTVDDIINKFSNTICKLFEEKRFARIQSQCGGGRWIAKDNKLNNDEPHNILFEFLSAPANFCRTDEQD